MERKILIICLPLLVVGLGTCVAHEYTVFHQQSNWDPQKFTQNVFAQEDFPAAFNPELTNLFTASAKPEEAPEEIDDQCTLYKARLTQKELYFQYVRYKTEIPELKEFTLCIWMRSENLSKDHTILSYAVDGQPHEIRSWLSNTNRASYFNLAVGGSDGKGRGETVHLFSINYPFRRRRWYHTCQSWSGETGNWLVYVEGERIGAGNSPQTIGRFIRRGGVAVTGQTQGQPGGGFIEEDGFEGEATLFKLLPRAFSRPLKIADAEGARMYQTSCDGLCRETSHLSPLRIRSNPKTSESRLSSQAREVLSLSPDRPIRVADMPSGIPVARKTYFVREENSAGNVPPSLSPSTFLTPFKADPSRRVLFQTTPVEDGGVQRFYTPGGRRATRSLGHELELVPQAAHLTGNGFLYRPKQLILHHAFVPVFDFGLRNDYFGPLSVPQGALQEQLNRQLVSQVKPIGQNGGHLEPNARVNGEIISISSNPSPPLSISNVNQVVSTGGNEKDRVSKLVVQKPEAGRLYQSSEGFGRPADQLPTVMEVTPIIDWRMTPKKLYAGAMWLRANPVCRKF